MRPNSSRGKMRSSVHAKSNDAKMSRTCDNDRVQSYTPSSLQGEFRAGGRFHTPSRVAPPVGRHQLPRGSFTYLLEG